MRRLITATVVPVALITALALTATAADAGKPNAVPTKAKITSINNPPPDHTWVFKGRVSSNNPKCLGKRRVAIFPVEPIDARGVAPTGPTVVGKTKKSGKFVLDTDQELLLFAPYVAKVSAKKRPGLACESTTSKKFDPSTN